MYTVTVPTLIDYGEFNREKTLVELQRAGAHRIALALSRDVDAAFSPPATLSLLRDLIAYFEANGLEVIVWLGETLGHSADGVKFYEKYGHIRHADGRDIASFCPTDPIFTADFVQWVKNVAQAGGKMILLDDDFRLGCRGGFGCFCEKHMAMTSRILGRPITREELLPKAFCGKAGPERAAWLKAQGDSLRSFCKALRKGLDEINPEARLSFCACIDSWDCSDTDPGDLAEIMAGNTRPFLRLIGAPYWASSGRKLGEIIEYERKEKHWLKNPALEIMSEGDSYPRPRTLVPAAWLEGFDTALRADGSLGGILKYMLDYVSDADYETGYVDAHTQNTSLYAKLEKNFAAKKAVGVRPYEAMHLLKDAELPSYTGAPSDQLENRIQTAPIAFGVVNSLPISYEEELPLLLFGENARHVTRREMENGAVIDYPAAKILQERGYNLGISLSDSSFSREALSFTDVPSEFAIDEQCLFRLTGNVATKAYTITSPERVRLLSQYHYGKNTVPGWAFIETEDGLRFIYLPFNAEDAIHDGCWLGGYAHRRILLREWEALTGEPFDAITLGNHPMLYQMCKKGDDTLAIGLWNFALDKISSIEIALKETWKEAEFIDCSGVLEEGRIKITSTLYPYEFAGVLLR